VSERRLVNDEIVRVPTPRRRRRRRWLIALLFYVAALAASAWVRARLPEPDPEPRESRVRLVGRGPDTPTPGHPPVGPVTIAYERRCPDAGSASPRPPAVLLLHGSPGSRHDFDGLFDPLSRDRCVIAPDLPGFGQTTRSIPDYSVHAHAAYVEALLDALGEREVHVVGFSMGSGVAIALAARAPARVRSLTLLSGVGIEEQELFGRYRVNHAVHGAQLAAIWLVIEATPHFGAFDRALMGVEYARNFYDTDQRPLRPALLAFAGPALVYHGRHDFLVPYGAALEHHRLLPQSRLVTGEGDHFDTFMRPGEVAAAIRPFLADVDAGRAPTRAQAPAASRLEAAGPYTGPIGSPHMGPRLLIEIGVPISLLICTAFVALRRRRRSTAGLQ
jgi:pimeloyl-ACP methyl ester carboxylesterase